MKGRREFRFTFPLDDERHGTTNGYTNLGCRCTRCKDAGVEDAIKRRAVRVAEFKAGLHAPPHGTFSTYTNYACRCDECKAANAARGRAYYARRRDEQVAS